MFGNFFMDKLSRVRKGVSCEIKPVGHLFDGEKDFRVAVIKKHLHTIYNNY